MLSNHIFTQAVEQQLYPAAKELEARCLMLFNKQFIPGRGITAMLGTNELAFTITYLKSAANLLIKIAEKQHIEIPENLKDTM